MYNFSLPPLLPTTSWYENPTFEKPCIQSPEIQVDQLEQEADREVEHLPERERAAYKTLLRREVAHMRKVIMQMREEGFKENAINEAIGELTDKFFESRYRFLEETNQFDIKKAEVFARNQATTHKINQCTVDFSPIDPIPLDDMMDLKNPRYFEDLLPREEVSEQSSFQRFLKDKATERVVTARVTAETLNAISYIAKESIAVVLGCRGSEEGARNCKAVLEYINTGAKKVGEIAKEVVFSETLNAIGYGAKESAAVVLGCRSSEEGARNCKAVLEYINTGAKKVEEVAKATVPSIGPAVQRMRSGNALTQHIIKLGIDREKALQYVEDSNSIFFRTVFAGSMIGAFKIFKAVFPPLPKQAPQLIEVPFHNKPFPHLVRAQSDRLTFTISSTLQAELKQLLLRDRFNVSKEHFINRKITSKTRMTPEDFGIGSIEYFKSKRPDFKLLGWMSKQEDVFKIVVERAFVPNGRLSNWLALMSNFQKIAKANDARVLQFEAQIVNEQLLAIMKKRYGEPSIVFKIRDLMLVEYQVFEIPLK